MSKTTSETLRKLFIYQVYVRNHTEEGTFKALINDLDRIQALGVDIVYLLPIHEIGELNRKGTLGSPYAIKDYYSINHELGTLEDFKQLIQEVHNRNMQIMMDIVFNHTSPDSVLVKEHPEFFYRNEKGEFSNRVGDWWDIIDFDYTNDPALYQTLIDVLSYWTKLGVDGFRFDVPSLLPFDFLEKAHNEILKINPNHIWLSESVHGSFLRHIRNLGFEGLSESEIYQIFDMAYDYDTHPYFEGYLKGENSLKAYTDALLNQEAIYPKNYVKLRNLENHDFGRLAGFVKENPVKIKNWHAFSFFNKGATMVFGGGEFSNPFHPSLFDKDTISREHEDISDLIKVCASLVKDDIFTYGAYELEAQNDCIIASYTYKNEKIYGIFNVSDQEGSITLKPLSVMNLFDDVKEPPLHGTFINLIDQKEVHVQQGTLTLSKSPQIFRVKK
ncbi:MAG: alpha-amylase family glycosyl hydrolase [Candidatus Izemoplasmataceae bacterium]